MFTLFTSSDHVLNGIYQFLYVTFLNSICKITYVPRWIRTYESGMIFCQLPPTLHHCETEDYEHVLLFEYLYLNLTRFL